MIHLQDFLSRPGRTTVAGVPEGFDALVLAALTRQRGGDLVHVARDEARMARLAETLRYVAADVPVLELPGWDTVPYDRSSPNVEVVARRVETLAALARGASPEVPPARVVLTTLSAALQRVPPRSVFEEATFAAAAGQGLDVDALMLFLARNGYNRTDTVMEPGEYAVRGGIIDIFPPGSDEPLRLDLFGDELETIRTFDPISQKSTGRRESLLLMPMGEVVLDEESVARFRSNYRAMFGTVTGADPLYEAISEGRKFPGMEQWLPLFHDGLDTLFAYLPDAAVTLDHQADEAAKARWELIDEYYQARRDIGAAGLADASMIYHPVPPERLYVPLEEWERLLRPRPVGAFSPFAAPEGAPGTVDAGGRPGRDFGDVRADPKGSLYDAVRDHARDLIREGRQVVIAAYTAGSRDRLAGLLRDHGLRPVHTVESWEEARALDSDATAVAALAIERGFVAPDLAVVSEQDILGERMARPQRARKRRAEQFVADVSALTEGDLVVHVEHGIGRYDGLETLQVAGAPHDCLRVVYEGGDKLYVPVENIEVLSRYGSEQAGVALDRLGGAAWQARKAKLKQRIRDMAEKLIAIAAQRQLKSAEALAPPEGLYDEFCARFPFAETDDQLRAIAETLEDMGSGRPMDRLVCGDVGFGKTEVALRAAFVAAMSGSQVAVVVPTTLLARQHYRTFCERFAGFPVRIELLSRLVTPKKASEVRRDLAEGKVDIIIGTHALLAKTIKLPRLGLLVVDEEQHFGVAHKERLKQLKADVHVLTLTATPIPRTLQLALTGVREMSVIATPPVDRLAVRTFVLPFDGVVIREAILRERYRGGQVFYVCPRVADLDRVAERLRKLVPEIKFAVAHGRMSATELEEVMAAFGEGAFDVLVSTNIIESGLDMPRVNTIVIHRADMFGLAQLYQLRGRVGRAKARGYAYLTLPPGKVLTKAAEKRLQVMQALDSLGAGFSLASHDLDIRGAGNLLGEEQSGHIKEVGIELYQQMLEEAVAAARGGEAAEAAEEEWSPQITIGTPVLIPETYVPDLSVRLGLYRRIAAVTDGAEVDSLAAELVDRFGPLPPEVENLLQIVTIKVMCRAAGVEKVEAGPKGAVVTFRNNSFANPAGLVAFINQQVGTVKLRPDHKLVYRRDWERPAQRVSGLQHLLKRLAELAQAA